MIWTGNANCPPPRGRVGTFPIFVGCTGGPGVCEPPPACDPEQQADWDSQRNGAVELSDSLQWMPGLAAGGPGTPARVDWAVAAAQVPPPISVARPPCYHLGPMRARTDQSATHHNAPGVHSTFNLQLSTFNFQPSTFDLRPSVFTPPLREEKDDETNPKNRPGAIENAVSPRKRTQNEATARPNEPILRPISNQTNPRVGSYQPSAFSFQLSAFGLVVSGLPVCVFWCSALTPTLSRGERELSACICG